MSELVEKGKRIRGLMAEKGLNALLLRRVSNFAWLTGGASSYVNTAVEVGAASLLLTPYGKYCITNNIEAPRLEKEEKLGEQGYEFKVAPWYEADEIIARLAKGLRLGADVPHMDALNVGSDLARLRSRLLPEETERFRRLGEQCGQAIQAAIRRVEPGLSEHQIAGLLAEEALARGLTPIVNLIATDQRIWDYRHPLPTAKVLERYAMLVLCGRKWGLVGSVTRFVHFGPLSDELRRKQDAVAKVDATFIAATRPGARVAEIFRRAIKAYAEVGYPDEWKLHHQGGAAGYEPREYVATLDSTEEVYAGQAFAWNPSITGVKSEDTILIGSEANEILTAVGDWPMIPVEIEGQVIERPTILSI